MKRLGTETAEDSILGWGGEFWSDGFFASTVGKQGDEAKIANYVKNQGSDAKFTICESCLPFICKRI